MIEENDMKNRLYILIDKNLDPIYGAVQGGHAVAKWLIEHGQEKWNNEYLIYLKADLEDIQEILFNINYSKFYEPDLNNKLTTIAIYEGDMNNRLKRKIKKLKLWGT